MKEIKQHNPFSSVFHLWLIFISVISLTANDKPNILWLTSEDNNVTFMGCYGNEQAVTPNIDKLAAEGFRYTHCYSNGAVCSATRSSWITGMISVSTGLHNHRGGVQVPDEVIFYPTQLQKAGYYTSNFKKKDYNVSATPRINKVWDSGKLDWEKVKAKQPFFQVINFGDSHEGNTFWVDHTRSSKDIPIPPYHPETPIVRANYAHYYEAVTRMDKKIGETLKQLEKNGLAENTIVVYNSDHGGPLARGKRYLFNSGTHCPLVVRIPEKFKKLWPAEKTGSVIDRLVSFADMPRTWISLAGGVIPENYHGRVFLGTGKEPEAKYHFSFRGRNDARIESARSIRDKQFLFIKNFMPYIPRSQYLDFQWKMPTQEEWEKEYEAGRLNDIQKRFFEERPKEEFYDTVNDPYCINNLINSPEHGPKIQKLRMGLDKEIVALRDAGLMPESDINKRAQDHGITVYELIRKPELYNVKRYLECADIALDKDLGNVVALKAMLKDSDSAVRYWGIVGIFLLREEIENVSSVVELLLADDSHMVRLMAAWILMEFGEKEIAVTCIRSLLKEQSYAITEVFNVIDWMGAESRKMFAQDVAKVNVTSNAFIRSKIMNIMKDYLVNGRPDHSKRWKAKMNK